MLSLAPATAPTLQAWVWMIFMSSRDDGRLEDADYCCWETSVDGGVAQKVEKIRQRPNQGQERLGTSLFGRKTLQNKAHSDHPLA